MSSAATPALVVRSNLIYRLIHRLHALNLNEKLSLSFQLALSSVQLVGIPVILIRTWHQPCDQPLRIYLVLHILRVALVLPCSVCLALSRRSRRNESRSVYKSCRLLQHLLYIFSFICFIIGNYFFFETVTCKHTCKELYVSSAIALSLGYIYALEILLVILAVIFCLPVFIIGVAWFGWGEKKNEVGPLSQELIDRIPLVVYLPMLAQQSVGGEKDGEVEMEKQDSSNTLDIAPDQPPMEIEPEKSNAVDNRHIQTAFNITPDQSTTNIKLEHSTPDPTTEPQPDQSPLSLPHEAQDCCPNCSRQYPPTTITSPPKPRPKRKLWRLIRSPASEPPTTTGPPPDIKHAPWPIKRLDAHQATCAICLTDYSADDEWDVLRDLKGCGHCFHKDCLDPWLKTSGRCPLCQLPVT